MKQSKISRRSFLLGLGAVSAAAVLTACGGSSSTAASGSAASGSAASGSSVVYRTLDEIKASGTINIGVFSDKNPFGYVDENGEYQGYDVYFGNRLGEDLGVEINYVSTEAANRIEYLQTGKVDVILANFTVTPERAEEVDFALPYMNVALGVISPDSAVVTTLDLPDQGVPRHSAAEVRFLRHCQERPGERQRRGMGQRQHRGHRLCQPEPRLHRGHRFSGQPGHHCSRCEPGQHHRSGLAE